MFVKNNKSDSDQEEPKKQIDVTNCSQQSNKIKSFEKGSSQNNNHDRNDKIKNKSDYRHDYCKF